MFIPVRDAGISKDKLVADRPDSAIQAANVTRLAG
jgi:hypothetical protein